MESLKCENIFKEFGKVPVIEDVSFGIGDGECRAIIGPNGAGKTTLFNLIAGQLYPSAGRIYLLGQDITTIPLHERVHLGLARTFQITNLMFDLTVMENALLAIKVVMPFRSVLFRSQKRYAGLFDESERLLTQWGLWERRNDLVKNLSYGEQRQTELVMALASKPKILLLDEPTSGLSGAESVSFVDLIRKAKQDITVVIVEHHMDVIFDLADFISVLHYGKVIAEGTKEEIVTNAKVKEVYLGEDPEEDASTN
ncbi:MAG: ABC transporter ATP-binding protein [Desulfobacterales bacterium]|nr:ABC transporter ATP-binding protein [Desulfobacterales bacterium]